MGKGSAPSAPDPQQLAQAQMQINQQQAIQNAELNNVNQVGTQGSIQYVQTGVNPDGTPQYTQVSQLSPQLQALYNTNLSHVAGIQGAQGGLINKILNNINGGHTVGGIGSQSDAAAAMAAQVSPQALAQALSPMSTQVTQLPAYTAPVITPYKPPEKAPDTTKPTTAASGAPAGANGQTPYGWSDNSFGGGM